MVMRHPRRLGGGGQDGRRDEVRADGGTYRPSGNGQGAVTSSEGKKYLLTTAHNLLFKTKILSFKTRKEQSIISIQGAK